jgi:hypothetical protein
MRFRLFRSRAFWLGVPGLVFLLWAWGDSAKSEFKGHVTKGPWFVHLTQGAGYLQLQITRGVPVSRLDFSAERVPRVSGGESWPGLYYLPQWRHHESPAGWMGSFYNSHPSVTNTLILPHWFLLSFYALPWCGLVVWRWRRLVVARRVAAAIPPAQAAGS